jgi:predicted amidophosphoribosyltransferase
MAEAMDNPICPACKAENDEDAKYCDQCGQPLTAPDDAGDGADGDCPACGGKVETDGDGKGVCSRCGLELVETADAPAAPQKADADAIAKLTAAILEKTGAGIPIDRAVAEGCREIFSSAESAPAEADEPEPCPLCGVESPRSAAQCSGCGLWFGNHKAPCARCGRASVAGGKCDCGAILTLPKLLQYIEPSVRFVCSSCRAPYAVNQPECPDCGGSLISADRIKAFAAGQA